MSKVLVIGCGGVAKRRHLTNAVRSAMSSQSCASPAAPNPSATRWPPSWHPPPRPKSPPRRSMPTTSSELCDLINSYKPDLVMNIALPYQDLTIMDACLACGVNYMDTANYEPENTDDPTWRAIYEKRCKEEGFSAYFDYSWQWAYQEKV